MQNDYTVNNHIISYKLEVSYHTLLTDEKNDIIVMVYSYKIIRKRILKSLNSIYFRNCNIYNRSKQFTRWHIVSAGHSLSCICQRLVPVIPLSNIKPQVVVADTSSPLQRVMLPDSSQSVDICKHKLIS